MVVKIESKVELTLQYSPQLMPLCSSLQNQMGLPLLLCKVNNVTLRGSVRSQISYSCRLILGCNHFLVNWLVCIRTPVTSSIGLLIQVIRVGAEEGREMKCLQNQLCEKLECYLKSETLI